MANYDSIMVTTKRFKVRDYEAFKEEMEKLHVYESNWDGSGLTFDREDDNTIWIGGYDAYLAIITDWASGKEVDLVPIIQKHMTPDSVAIINQVGHEKLRCADGTVHVITPTAYMNKDLDEMGKDLAKKLFIATLPKKVKLLCNCTQQPQDHRNNRRHTP